ncbi:MAG: hypothetical protein LC808_10460, partial [Actinobacteria bacterium]|nr:hypothetical protein [Actinomycetota bacterium]
LDDGLPLGEDEAEPKGEGGVDPLVDALLVVVVVVVVVVALLVVWDVVVVVVGLLEPEVDVLPVAEGVGHEGRGGGAFETQVCWSVGAWESSTAPEASINIPITHMIVTATSETRPTFRRFMSPPGLSYRPYSSPRSSRPGVRPIPNYPNPSISLE